MGKGKRIVAISGPFIGEHAPPETRLFVSSAEETKAEILGEYCRGRPLPATESALYVMRLVADNLRTVAAFEGLLKLDDCCSNIFFQLCENLANPERWRHLE